MTLFELVAIVVAIHMASLAICVLLTVTARAVRQRHAGPTPNNMKVVVDG